MRYRHCYRLLYPLTRTLQARALRDSARHLVGMDRGFGVDHRGHMGRQRRGVQLVKLQLGEGWVAEEALAIAIYCALVARSFRDGVVLAVNHDGDSDSTGAIAGNLLGALHGMKAIPREWLEPLELREVITTLAEDLYAFRDWEIGEMPEHEAMNAIISRKYPGC